MFDGSCIFIVPRAELRHFKIPLLDLPISQINRSCNAPMLRAYPSFQELAFKTRKRMSDAFEYGCFPDSVRPAYDIHSIIEAYY
ncbi:hypothetical protein D3C78_1899340 [compost metagenome]